MCDQRGITEIVGCMREQVEPWTWDVLMAADLWEHGCMPIGGGWRDQVSSLVPAVRFVAYERQKAVMAKREKSRG